MALSHKRMYWSEMVHDITYSFEGMKDVMQIKMYKLPVCSLGSVCDHAIHFFLSYMHSLCWTFFGSVLMTSYQIHCMCYRNQVIHFDLWCLWTEISPLRLLELFVPDGMQVLLSHCVLAQPLAPWWLQNLIASRSHLFAFSANLRKVWKNPDWPKKSSSWPTPLKPQDGTVGDSVPQRRLLWMEEAGTRKTKSSTA